MRFTVYGLLFTVYCLISKTTNSQIRDNKNFCDFCDFCETLTKTTKTRFMNNCKEYYLDDARAIRAIPISEKAVDGKVAVDETDPTSPANRLTPTIDSEMFIITDDTIFVGRYRPVEYEMVRDDVAFIPMQPGTGKVKDTQDDSVAGRLHTVTVTFDADDRESEVWANLLTLERTPCHLELTFRDGKTRAFIAGSEDTWQCNTNRDGSKTTVTIRMQNLMGVQLMVGQAP